MSGFPDDPGFFGIIKEMPLFFKLFGGTIFLVVVGSFLYVIIRGLWTWTSNNASEVLTCTAGVVDKRTEVWGGTGNSRSRTSYYVTFELVDGSRIELPVRGDRFGYLVVGDQGELTYQGTRFKDFRR
ncbi:uncharacterized protein DUF2500 [Paenibacillus taihuensis]|uniref:Uncharacterized protein DUF2500 n=1 Tax=Paenibacillus taihuensis TaxID=1156355 RepID=A0A3D9QWZ4_9BACL|nr:DUF2500 domain-containing protein [Paenibacillus taihuensis]REE68740.1 uncharacterized protein DUF2500 [Paenibacillus taihuensis]